VLPDHSRTAVTEHTRGAVFVDTYFYKSRIFKRGNHDIPAVSSDRSFPDHFEHSMSDIPMGISGSHIIGSGPEIDRNSGSNQNKDTGSEK
jgi:hypothetical protein